MKGSQKLIVVLGFAFVVIGMLFFSLPASAQEDNPFDQNPLLYGAWLYESNCTRCHGSYETSRVGSGLDDKDRLYKYIEGGSPDGCQVAWGRKFGGTFGVKEIEALVTYILEWENNGPPDIGELPPTPSATVTPSPTLPGEKGNQLTPTFSPSSQMDDDLKMAIESNRLSLGAYLYTTHCYRCHLSYETKRQGRGLSEDRLYTIIKDGLLSSSMPSFYYRNGGALKGSEIQAIVYYILSWEKLGESPVLPEILFKPPTPDPKDFEMIYPPTALPSIGDANNGESLFARFCIHCHGIHAEGGLGSSLVNKDFHSIRADLTVQSIIQNGVPGSLMPAWDQQQGSLFSQDQIQDLVAYILIKKRLEKTPTPAKAIP